MRSDQIEDDDACSGLTAGSELQQRDAITDGGQRALYDLPDPLNYLPHSLAAGLQLVGARLLTVSKLSSLRGFDGNINPPRRPRWLDSTPDLSVLTTPDSSTFAPFVDEEVVEGDDIHDKPLGQAFESDLQGNNSPEYYHRHHRRRRSSCIRYLAYAMLIIFIALLAAVIHFWRLESSIRAPWTPDADSVRFSQRPLPPPLERAEITSYQLPLRTKGRSIVDATGRRFKFSSVNWYGASDELFVPGGLDVQHRTVIAKTIKKLGFNSVRLPYADELVMANPRIEDRLIMANSDLFGLRALDVLEAVTNALTDEGIAVIMNNHITSATWCCGADPCDAGWANDQFGPICRVRQTEEQWIQNWEAVMLPHVHNPLMIGVDLRNEVRGLWGTMPWSKWAAAAEKCGNRLLKMNPNWLVVVEGTESANDLSGARTRPVRLDVEDRLVYSAHVYGWSGWGSTEGRFVKRSYESFVRTMQHNWGYLLEQDIAPVWVGEFGAPHLPNIGDHHYWRNLMRYLKSVDADFGYWAINPRKPRGNTLETYALVEDDWVTPILDYRMKDMTELIRQ